MPVCVCSVWATLEFASGSTCSERAAVPSTTCTRSSSAWACRTTSSSRYYFPSIPFYSFLFAVFSFILWTVSLIASIWEITLFAYTFDSRWLVLSIYHYRFEWVPVLSELAHSFSESGTLDTCLNYVQKLYLFIQFRCISLPLPHSSFFFPIENHVYIIRLYSLAFSVRLYSSL